MKISNVRKCGIGIGNVLMLVVTGCSSPESSGNTNSDLVATRVQPTVATFQQAPTVHLAAPVNKETPVYVQVMPQGECKFSATAKRMFANDRGIIQFTINPMLERTVTQHLLCEAAGAVPTTYPLEITGTSDATLISASRARMATLDLSMPGSLRPPLTGDPMLYTQTELLSRGYGMRPDPFKHPAPYAKWLNAARQGGINVAPRTIMGDRSNGTAPIYYNGGDGQGGWSGAVDTESGNHFNDAEIQFDVPKVFAEGFPNCFNHSSASTWAGIGENPVWQSGVEEDTYTESCVQDSNYQAFYQLAPTDSYGVNVPNITIRDGDDVSAHVWICDPTVDYIDTTPSNPNATFCYEFFNFTDNNAEQFGTRGSAYNKCCFGSGEAIQEWDDSGQNDYAQFNAFSTNYTNLIDYSGNECSIGSQDIFTTTVWEIGSSSHTIGGACLAGSNGTCNNNPSLADNAVRFWWNSHQ